MTSFRAELARCWHLPSPRWLPGPVPDLLGTVHSEPGRLHTFLAGKPHG